jgi:hypothetical protein
MGNAQRFNFTEGFDGFGVPDALPQLPISLTYQDRSVEFSALLDTGASVIADLVGCVPYCNSDYPTDRLLGTHHAHKFLDIKVLIEAVVCCM